MSKGSRQRPEAEKGAYATGYDLIKWSKGDEPQPEKREDAPDPVELPPKPIC